MVRILALSLLFPCLGSAASAIMGGWIAPVSRIVCAAYPALDFSRDGEEIPVATCMISNNSPLFQASFRFDTENGLGDFGDLRERFASLTLHGVSGTLGQGIEPPRGQDILPLMEGNVFTWAPEEQHSATLDYFVEFRASWKAEKEPEFSRILITTDLASAL